MRRASQALKQFPPSFVSYIIVEASPLEAYRVIHYHRAMARTVEHVIIGWPLEGCFVESGHRIQPYVNTITDVEIQSRVHELSQGYLFKLKRTNMPDSAMRTLPFGNWTYPGVHRELRHWFSTVLIGYKQMGANMDRCMQTIENHCQVIRNKITDCNSRYPSATPACRKHYADLWCDIDVVRIHFYILQIGIQDFKVLCWHPDDGPDEQPALIIHHWMKRSQYNVRFIIAGHQRVDAGLKLLHTTAIPWGGFICSSINVDGEDATLKTAMVMSHPVDLHEGHWMHRPDAYGYQQFEDAMSSSSCESEDSESMSGGPAVCG